ncbi:MAG TPA: hypothetical protein VN032_04895 [Thermoanaerobaculia bacterium]|jgi:hypothetical protein|nr:hypothetical protein [Thermoanaerobaculia bacterium]
MSRKSLSRTTAQALGPLVVPLVTKIALPIAIESLRRGGKFDTDRFYAEAKESLAKGFKKSRPELDDLKDELSDRGSDLYDDLRKHGAELLETLTEKGSSLADDWMGRVRPRRRRFRLIHALGILAVVGVGVALVGRR